MRVWMVTRPDVPYGVFLTEAEARMYAMMKWPQDANLHDVQIFEWDETMDFFDTLNAALQAANQAANPNGIDGLGW